eukprot:1156013-Pelagomonas_calceolata.AAC.3
MAVDTERQNMRAAARGQGRGVHNAPQGSRIRVVPSNWAGGVWAKDDIEDLEMGISDRDTKSRYLKHQKGITDGKPCVEEEDVEATV